MMNLSEAEEFDNQFPEHPLSRLKKYMKQIEENIKLMTAFLMNPSLSMELIENENERNYWSPSSRLVMTHEKN